MYALTMSSIDGFESGSPPAADRGELREPTELFLDTLEALKVSVEAAKTPFARLSKQLLQEGWKERKVEVKLGSTDELSLGDDTVLTTHHTITARLPDKSSWIWDELVWFCDEVWSGLEERSVTILSGLQVDIRKLSEEHFTFSWKLRYVVHHG
jgi:hypothetical protein